MKQAILTFEKCRVLLVELPDNTVSVEPSYCHAIIWKDNTGYIETEYPLGWESQCIIEPVGKLSELTEEQAKGIVSKRGDWFANYPEERLLKPGGYVPYVYTAVRSFFSKLKAEGYTAQEHPKVLSDSENSLSAEELERNFQPSRTWVFTIKQ